MARTPFVNASGQPGQAQYPGTPAVSIYLVSPSDTVNLPTPGYIRADAAGAVKILGANDSTPVTLNLLQGECPPVLVQRVYATPTPPACHCLTYGTE